MRILHTITGLSKSSGGTSSCTYELVSALNQLGCQTDILTALPPKGDTLVGEGDFIHAIAANYITPYAYSSAMRQELRNISGYDLIHINGMWADLNYYSGVIARKKQIPYVVSPHGMLYPQALAIKPWRKKLMRYLCFDNLLRHAACIHVTCEEEKKHYRNLGFINPVAVIPNPLRLPIGIEDVPCVRDKKRIGFLGRFHPIKNIPALLQAWSMLGKETQEAELLLIGDGNEEYKKEIKAVAEKAPCHNIRFCGFADGMEKYRLLGSLSALCVPSIQENFGMTVLEAWTMRTPVIASKGTPWQELETHHCGWHVENDPETLSATIRHVLSMSAEERAKMGENGYLLLQKKYVADKVATQMANLYEWLIHGGKTPEFLNS